MKKIITGASAALPLSAFANGSDGFGMMHGFGGGGMYFGSLMWLMWLVWTAVGILAVVWLWKQINKK